MIYVIHWFVNILTLGLVSIATITTTTYHVDEPITELNNQSLNDVFDIGNLIQNHDFSNGTNYWYNYNSTSMTNVNNELLVVQGGIYRKIYHNNSLNLSLNDHLYIRYGAYSNTSGLLIPHFRYTTLTSSPIVNYTDFEANLTTSYQDYSFKITLASDVNYLWVEGTTNFDYYLDNIFIVNLTDLGIDNLTKSQLDDWYDIYIQAVANNGVYIESTSHLNNNIHLVDVSVMVISFGLWVWLFKFLKGVIF